MPRYKHGWTRGIHLDAPDRTRASGHVRRHAGNPHPLLRLRTPFTAATRSPSTTRPAAGSPEPHEPCFPFSRALYIRAAPTKPRSLFLSLRFRSLALARNQKPKLAAESRPPRRGIRSARLRKSAHLPLPPYLSRIFRASRSFPHPSSAAWGRSGGQETGETKLWFFFLLPIRFRIPPRGGGRVPPANSRPRHPFPQGID
jgi:hypothetical protein